MKSAVAGLIIFLSLFSAAVFAHEVRPGYLELRQTAADVYSVLWKVPGKGDNQRLGLAVDLPANCTRIGELQGTMINQAYSERWVVECAGGLAGGTIHIAGLSAMATDVLMRLESLDGTSQSARLKPAAPSYVVEALPGTWQVARTYLALGVEHILAGIDHLLFVFALLLLVKGTNRLIATITAFTIAHSLTLAAATLGWVHVPAPPVEAAIALSIVFLAVEIIRSQRGTIVLTQQFPWIIALIFGLLHGFGFAGALSEVGLPQSAIPVALMCFNIGVEIGQLIFVASVIALMKILRHLQFNWPASAKIIPPYLIGSCAAFWVIQRLTAF